jgi:hypothetical protein
MAGIKKEYLEEIEKSNRDKHAKIEKARGILETIAHIRVPRGEDFEAELLELYSLFGVSEVEDGKCQGCGYLQEECVCSENIEER